jgi:ABC-type multidrug transport system fused ATPase/permease subunit
MKYTMLSSVIVFAFVRMVMLLFFVPPAMVSSKRINEVFKTHSSIIPGKIKYLPKFKTLEFKNVSLKFTTGSDYALKNINFKLNKGETLAIVGSTGSGKSTVINLIPRIYEATEGEILFNDINIKEYDTASLHNSIGFVPQKNFLFNTTVKENIKFGIVNKHLTSAEIDKRIK